MTPHPSPTHTAFAGHRRVVSGSRLEAALAAKRALGAGGAEPLVIFDDLTGAVVDFDLRGSEAEINARFVEADAANSRGRGRPKLGVVAREVTLLPRHWEWLAAQSGGASIALRRLVDQARHADGGETDKRMARDSTYRFLSAMAGDLPGFEEASRALFADDREGFTRRLAAWPRDIGAYALRLLSAAER